MVANTSRTEQEALRTWAGSLIALHESTLPAKHKAREAIQITYRAKVIWPMLKVIARQMKKHGWDDRSVSQRLGMSGAGMTMAVFGSANAGIAALGGAVGVPLWVVFGAGAMFARHLYEELGGGKSGDPKATYHVIDAEKEEDRD